MTKNRLASKIKFRYFYFALIIIFISCNSNSEYFVLPNGEVIPNMRLNEFSKQYPLYFRQYEGFFASYDDTVFSEMRVVPKRSLLYTDEISSWKIIMLRFRNIDHFTFFISLSDTGISTCAEFERLMLSRYKRCSKVIIHSRDFKLIDSTGNTICTAEYQGDYQRRYIVYIPSCPDFLKMSFLEREWNTEN